MPNEIMRDGPATAEPCSIADDLLEGADEISAFIFGDRSKRRKIYHLAQSSNLPVFRLGAVLCARKSRITEWIEDQEKQADARLQRIAECRREERMRRLLVAEKAGGSA